MFDFDLELLYCVLGFVGLNPAWFVCDLLGLFALLDLWSVGGFGFALFADFGLGVGFWIAVLVLLVI